MVQITLLQPALPFPDPASHTDDRVWEQLSPGAGWEALGGLPVGLCSLPWRKAARNRAWAGEGIDM